MHSTNEAVGDQDDHFIQRSNKMSGIELMRLEVQHWEDEITLLKTNSDQTVAMRKKAQKEFKQLELQNDEIKNEISEIESELCNWAEVINVSQINLKYKLEELKHLQEAIAKYNQHKSNKDNQSGNQLSQSEAETNFSSLEEYYGNLQTNLSMSFNSIISSHNSSGHRSYKRVDQIMTETIEQMQEQHTQINEDISQSQKNIKNARDELSIVEVGKFKARNELWVVVAGTVIGWFLMSKSTANYQIFHLLILQFIYSVIIPVVHSTVGRVCKWRAYGECQLDISKFN